MTGKPNLRTAVLIHLFLLSLCSWGQTATTDSSGPPYSIHTIENEWINTLLDSMSLDEQIGQLFMVAAYSNKNAAHIAEIEQLIKQYKIGGLIFFQDGPVRQARLTNHYQKQSETPLMIAMDAEWGLDMRLDSTFRFPWPMTLGAIQNDSLIYQMGLEIARHCRRLGVHINFAPVVDINTNPENPIINAVLLGKIKIMSPEKGWLICRACKTTVCWLAPNISPVMVIRIKTLTIPYP